MKDATGKIRVVVVDDSALVRSILSTLIDSQADMACIGVASDPLVAREMIRELNPDVITLDVEMPKMDGLDFLEKLMRLRPMPVVMVSTLTERGAETTLRALELGAVDFVAKPRLGLAQGRFQPPGKREACLQAREPFEIVQSSSRAPDASTLHTERRKHLHAQRARARVPCVEACSCRHCRPHPVPCTLLDTCMRCDAT